MMNATSVENSDTLREIAEILDHLVVDHVLAEEEEVVTGVETVDIQDEGIVAVGAERDAEVEVAAEIDAEVGVEVATETVEEDVAQTTGPHQGQKVDPVAGTEGVIPEVQTAKAVRRAGIVRADQRVQTIKAALRAETARAALKVRNGQRAGRTSHGVVQGPRGVRGVLVTKIKMTMLARPTSKQNPVKEPQRMVIHQNRLKKFVSCCFKNVKMVFHMLAAVCK